jgi:hypothetical protein
MASDTIARCTRNQLCLLALVFFVEEVNVRDQLDEPGFRHWRDLFLRPFDDLEFRDIDARHLVALGAITYDPASERDLLVWLQLKNQYDDIDFEKLFEITRVEVLKMNWDMGMPAYGSPPSAQSWAVWYSINYLENDQSRRGGISSQRPPNFGVKLARPAFGSAAELPAFSPA